MHFTAENIDCGRSHKLLQSHPISGDRKGIGRQLYLILFHRHACSNRHRPRVQARGILGRLTVCFFFFFKHFYRDITYIPNTCPSTVYNAVSFSLFRVMRLSAQSTFRHFHHPKRKMNFPQLLHPQATNNFPSVSVDWPILDTSYKWIMQYICPHVL